MNEFIFTKRLVSERAVLLYIYILRIFVIVVAFFLKVPVLSNGTKQKAVVV